MVVSEQSGVVFHDIHVHLALAVPTCFANCALNPYNQLETLETKSPFPASVPCWYFNQDTHPNESILEICSMLYLTPPVPRLLVSE